MVVESSMLRLKIREVHVRLPRAWHSRDTVVTAQGWCTQAGIDEGNVIDLSKSPRGGSPRSGRPRGGSPKGGTPTGGSPTGGSPMVAP